MEVPQYSTTASEGATRTLGRRVWRTLGARIAAWYVVVTLCAFGAAAMLLSWRAQRSVELQGQHLANQTLARFRESVESEGLDALRSMVKQSRGAVEHVAVRVVDERHLELLSESSDASSAQVAAKFEATSLGALGDWHMASARVALGTLEVVVHNDRAAPTRRDATFALAAVAIVGVLAAVVGALLISRRALAPIADLASCTQQIVASGDLSLRIPIAHTGDDLEKLAQLINQMLERNETLVRVSRDSLDNVAHDLRTPLTRLRTHAELALQPASSVEQPNAALEALADVVEETDKVLSLLRTLMDIAEANAGVMKLQKREEDLAEIASEAVELYDIVSAERGVRIITHLTSGVRVLADRQRLVQVCANLVDNAVKYSPAGSTVEVTARASGSEAVLLVEDRGIGIPPHDRPRIWDRLFRGDRSRSQRGLGLGLSLVKAVVEMHGGQVRLLDGRDRGSAFEVRLPRGGKLS